MYDAVEVLQRRDGMSKEDAESMVSDFKERLLSGEIDPFSADDDFMDEFGLEPDYLLDMLM